MKYKFIFIFLILIGSFSNSRGQWVQTNGPYAGGKASSFAAIGTNLFTLINYNGVYRSFDSGVSWQPVGKIPPSAFFSIFANGTSLFVATYSYGIFRSVDS